MQAGIVAAALANAWVKRKDRQPFTALDFMPDFWPSPNPSHTPSGAPKGGGERRMVEVESMAIEQQIGWLEMLNLAYGGKDLR